MITDEQRRALEVIRAEEPSDWQQFASLMWPGKAARNQYKVAGVCLEMLIRRGLVVFSSHWTVRGYRLSRLALEIMGEVGSRKESEWNFLN